MAKKEYVILIRNEAGKQGVGKKVGGAGGIGNAQGGESAGGEGRKQQKSATAVIEKSVKGLLTYGAVSSIVDKVASHNHSLIEIRSGSKELQQRTTYQYNLAKSFVNSVATGAISGATVGGPGGAAVGAALAIAMQGVSFGVNYVQQTSVIAENKRAESIQRQSTIQRATVSGSRYMNATQM